MSRLKLATLLSALTLLALPASSSAVEVVADGSFEGATGAPLNSPSWSEADSIFGSPLCTAACNPPSGPQAPRTGAIWAWFGGNTGPQTGSLSQSVAIPRGTATLTFYFFRTANTGGGSLNVTIDGVSQFTANDASPQTAYTPITRDISLFANGLAHTLTFSYTDPAAGGVTNLQVDDVSINATPAPPPAKKCKKRKKKGKKGAAVAKKCKKKKKRK